MNLKQLMVLVALAGFALNAVPSFAQASENREPVLLKRQKSDVPPAPVPSLKDYPFAEIQAKLAEGDKGALVSAPSPAIVRETENEVPSSFVAHRQVALTQTGAAALALGKRLSSELNIPAPGSDGRVVYGFGVGTPTVICAPLRVCSLELQAGEKINGEPQMGDSVRWDVSPVNSGTGEAMIPILVIKPKMAGLDTTMIVTTDRRTYYVRLISEPESFVARTGFAYSDDEHVEWKIFLEAQQQATEKRLAGSRVEPTATRSIDNLYFDYTLKAKKKSGEIMPLRVMDDGEKTYIEMPAAISHLELPTLVIEGPSGNEMVNYRVKGTTFVVDRLFDRGALVMGVHRHQFKVEIVRDQQLVQGGK